MGYPRKKQGKQNFTSKCWDWVKGMVDEIADLTDEAKSSGSFQKWLKTQSAFHHYSYYNTMLIAIQNPQATRVMGGKSWNKVGRRVKQDQWRKKIWILAPILVNDEAAGFTSAGKPKKKLIGFRNVYVFDVGQTEGDELPELDYRAPGEDNGLCDALEAEFKRREIVLEYVDALGGANGTSAGGKVCILNSLVGAERAATMAHELAHEILHWAPGGGRPPEDGWYEKHTRSVKEIEAESTAAVVLGAWGLDYTASPMYLAAWQGDGKKVRESLGSIARASKGILSHILPTD
tara:strand:+ start:604 stop:1476 length:873 start_codon:yes stop_codon:yes gene_type:complete